MLDEEQRKSLNIEYMIGLRSEAWCIKLNIIKMISGNISHENATDQLIREYIMRRVGGLEKEEIPV